MARKAKVALQMPETGATYVMKNGDRRLVVAINGPFIEWKFMGGLFGCRTAQSGICALRSWSDRSPVLAS